MLAPARDNGSIDRSGAVVIEKLCERLRDGDFNHSQPQLLSQAGTPVARLQGDLWSGNVLWCPVGDVARSCKEFLSEKIADKPQDGAAIMKGGAAIMTSAQQLRSLRWWAGSWGDDRSGCARLVMRRLIWLIWACLGNNI